MKDKKFGKSNKMQVQKLPTGIEGFDDVCRGGLPVSRSTLVSGTSGTGKTVFSLQYLHHGICNFDEPGIFVTFEESPLDIIRNAASFGWDLQELIDQNKHKVYFYYKSFLCIIYLHYIQFQLIHQKVDLNQLKLSLYLKDHLLFF